MTNQIIIKPLITERSILMTKLGLYTFMVDKLARKTNIKNEVEKLFKVNVLAVRTITIPGKLKKVGRQMKKIRIPDAKKAIVRIKKDQKIAEFDVQT